MLCKSGGVHRHKSQQPILPDLQLSPPHTRLTREFRDHSIALFHSEHALHHISPRFPIDFGLSNLKNPSIPPSPITTCFYAICPRIRHLGLSYHGCSILLSDRVPPPTWAGLAGEKGLNHCTLVNTRSSTRLDIPLTKVPA